MLSPYPLNSANHRSDKMQDRVMKKHIDLQCEHRNETKTCEKVATMVTVRKKTTIYEKK